MDDSFSLLSSRAGYLGSAWRGAFGIALRRAACVTGLPDCDACDLVGSCPYPTIFESRTPPDATMLTRYPRTPNPYVLEPADRHCDAQDDTLNLGVTLFGRAVDHLPYIIRALQRAGAQGLTSRRTALELLSVQAEYLDDDGDMAWRDIYQPSEPLATTPAVERIMPPAPDAVRIRLISPLRIKRRGHFVGAKDFDFHAFAANLLRRISLLTNFFGDAPLTADFAGLLRGAEEVPVAKEDLRWRDLTRHSSRQHAKLKMGGLEGSFEVHAPRLDLFWPCLWLGQWTHVGKGCTMGLGRYALAPADADDRAWPMPERL